VAFVAWVYGLRRGPARTVGALAYAVPFVAAGLLIALDAAEASWRLAVGGSAVVPGVALANRAGDAAEGA
jgi:drug/metabolite transporter (DMT)-like permease